MLKLKLLRDDFDFVSKKLISRGWSAHDIQNIKDANNLYWASFRKIESSLEQKSQKQKKMDCARTIIIQCENILKNNNYSEQELDKLRIQIERWQKRTTLEEIQQLSDYPLSLPKSISDEECRVKISAFIIIITQYHQRLKEELADPLKDIQTNISIAYQKHLQLPNLPHDDISDCEKIIHTAPPISNRQTPSFQDISQLFNFADFDHPSFERGSVIYKNQGAKLFQSLTNVFINGLGQKYLNISGPSMVYDQYHNLSYNPQPPISVQTGRYLNSTGSDLLINLHYASILDIDVNNPKRIYISTHCFLNSSKSPVTPQQLNVIGSVIFIHPTQGLTLLDETLKDITNILDELNIPYQTTLSSYSQLPFSASKTYFIKVWSPHKQKYVEISSISYDNDFCSIRAKIRFRDNKKTQYAHTITTNIWMDKLFNLLIENNYQNDKTISISEILQPYISSIKILKTEISSCINPQSQGEAVISSEPNKAHSEIGSEIKIIHTSNTTSSKTAIAHHNFIKTTGMVITSPFTSGRGFVYYTEQGSQLFQALINFTLDFHEQRGYIRHIVPVIVNADNLRCTSQLPKFEMDLFAINDKYLSPTGEVQLVNLFRNHEINLDNGPIKLCTNSNCFRKEAGASGSDTKGLIRLHQFNKTELVLLCHPHESEKYLEEITREAEMILEALQLPYRRVLLPDYDLPFASTKTYDIEVWFPSIQKYVEISSSSNTLDFQSKRGGIVIKTQDTIIKNPHILNASGVAIDRLFAAIVENYQISDQELQIPEPLKKYIRNNKYRV